MASVDPQIQTTYATTDWDHYRQGRPSYPASLTEIIYSYRRRHPKAGWVRLVDVGAGSGVAATNFMTDFQTIHNSDPSPWNEEQARAFLSEWAQQHTLNPFLEYSQSSGEKAYFQTGEQSADLVICATAAHFMHPDGLVDSIGRMLRPGGTLAIFSYWMPSFPGRSERFHDVFGQTFDNLVLSKLLSCTDDVGRAKLAKVVERRMTGKGVLDSVPLPEDIFKDPLRVYINTDDAEVPYGSFFAKVSPGGVSRVKDGEHLVHYHTGTDKEAE
ncbi:uncharacterized protein ASPGLDRAFT_41931 [Aspergillus glaucus CBS 516.65]|uniref:Methyltransferase type 11 domain-containing protein n=1 Tax=Aspergillus glaucus CBS 516.65 TaxID=1160497 RepID=A0A1L9VWT8_ASPGL|nr:hypothetical protein ASPGLDRAFT_41931 [Aspergillus glaucus CBS 516.65]OJJ88365.1 hypothetical protein ASPGLDRAFT_41931 [Aspergillus glaucus CBS 516.65]